MAKKYTITKLNAEVREYTPEKQLVSVETIGSDDMQVSDGYHTMDELYDHRITLFIALARSLRAHKVWRSKRHSDGELAFGGTWFVLGIGVEAGKQITYHIPIERWEETNFAFTVETAPEWDGHTSADVIERLKKL